METKPTIQTHPTATAYVLAYIDWCWKTSQDASGFHDYGVMALVSYLDEKSTQKARPNLTASPYQPRRMAKKS